MSLLANNKPQSLDNIFQSPRADGWMLNHTRYPCHLHGALPISIQELQVVLLALHFQLTIQATSRTKWYGEARILCRLCSYTFTSEYFGYQRYTISRYFFASCMDRELLGGHLVSPDVYVSEVDVESWLFPQSCHRAITDLFFFQLSAALGNDQNNYLLLPPPDTRSNLLTRCSRESHKGYAVNYCSFFSSVTIQQFYRELRHPPITLATLILFGSFYPQSGSLA